MNSTKKTIAFGCDHGGYLLKNAAIPTVLVECGFLSNAEESKRLQSEEYQAQLAEDLASAVETLAAEAGPYETEEAVRAALQEALEAPLTCGESDETALEAAKRETFEEAGVMNTFLLSFVGGRGHWRKHLNCNISKQAQEARPLDTLPDGMHKDL